MPISKHQKCAEALNCINITLNCSRKSAVDVEHFNALFFFQNFVLLCFFSCSQFWAIASLFWCAKNNNEISLCFFFNESRNVMLFVALRTKKKIDYFLLNIVLFIVKAIKLHVTFLVLTWTNSGDRSTTCYSTKFNTSIMVFGFMALWICSMDTCTQTHNPLRKWKKKTEEIKTHKVNMRLRIEPTAVQYVINSLFCGAPKPTNLKKKQ